MDGFKNLKKKTSKKQISTQKSITPAHRKPIQKRTSKIVKHTVQDDRHEDKVKTMLSIFNGNSLNEDECMLALSSIGYSAVQTQTIFQMMDQVVGELDPNYPKKQIFMACDKVRPKGQERYQAFKSLCDPNDDDKITLTNLQKILYNAKKAKCSQNNNIFDSMTAQKLQLITDFSKKDYLSLSEFEKLYNSAAIAQQQ